MSVFSSVFMGWRWALRGVAGVAGLCAIALTAVAEDVKAIAPCTLEPGPVGTVARVLDGETLVLDDGRAVRLIGALAPRARDAGATAGAWPPGIEASKALSDLVLGKKVKLAFGGRHTDRYGRFLAQVFLEDGRGEEWVQGALLAGGHARAYGLPESFVCARELLAHEVEARRRHLGIWSNGVYRPMPANRPSVLMKQREKYERVIGSVASVGRTKGATYLNFGTDWHSDFTVRIGKNVLAANPEWARTLDGLNAKTVIVRGWIERRNGPLIDVTDASQIEVIDGDAEPADVSASAPTSNAQPASVPADAVPNTGSPKNLRPTPPEGTEPGAVNL
ncbi:MAG TPA: thermonuclease family protein [Hyphomicrobium sp.]